MTTLSTDSFSRWSAEPSRTKTMVGDLADYLLGGDLRPHAADLQVPGTCILVYENVTGGAERLARLGTSFLVPVRWVRATPGAVHHAGLSASLREAADRVRAALAADTTTDVKADALPDAVHCTLQPLPAHTLYNWDDSSLWGESVDLALAIGLVQLLLDVKPQLGVFATGKLGSTGFEGVAVGNKLDAVRSCGFPDAKLYIPPHCVALPSPTPSDLVVLKARDSGTLRKQMTPALAQASQPPAAGDHLGWLRYLNEGVGRYVDRGPRDRHYERQLVDWFVDQHRWLDWHGASLPADVRPGWGDILLLQFDPNNPALALHIVRAYGCGTLWLLHDLTTERARTTMDAFVAARRREGLEVDAIPFAASTDDTARAALHDAIRERAASARRTVHVELLPGFKPPSLLLAFALAGLHNARRYCCDSPRFADGVLQFGPLVSRLLP